MFVLPNINGLGKRNKKKPKRYNECLLMDGTMDFVDLGDDPATTESAKDAVRCSVAGEYERMRHARVVLPKMTVLNSLEPLCMVHQLYRCFCKNQATTGEPFELIMNKPSPEETPQGLSPQLNSVHQWESIPPRKRQYTFEKGDVSADLKNKKSAISTMINADSHLTDLAARTRPYPGRKFVSKLVWRNKRVYYNSVEKQLSSKLLDIRRKCETSTAVPLRPLPMFIDIADDDNSDISPQKPVPLSPRASQSNTNGRSGPTKVIHPVNSRHIENFNQIVATTMRKIKMDQQKKGINLTDPSQCLMDCLRWSSIVEAYQSEKIFIWLVRFDNEHALLAVTNTEGMPLVHKASSVSNIRITETSSLPLIAKMLKKGITNENTKQMGM